MGNPAGIAVPFDGKVNLKPKIKSNSNVIVIFIFILVVVAAIITFTPILSILQPTPNQAQSESPSVEGTQSTPSVGETQSPPSVGETQSPPSVGETQSPPSVGETQSPPSVGDTQSPPSVEGTQSTPSVEGTQSTPSVGETQSPPSVGETQSPPSVGETQSPPSVGETQTLSESQSYIDTNNLGSKPGNAASATLTKYCKYIKKDTSGNKSSSGYIWKHKNYDMPYITRKRCRSVVGTDNSKNDLIYKKGDTVLENEMLDTQFSSATLNRNINDVNDTTLFDEMPYNYNKITHREQDENYDFINMLQVGDKEGRFCQDNRYISDNSGNTKQLITGKPFIRTRDGEAPPDYTTCTNEDTYIFEGRKYH